MKRTQLFIDDEVLRKLKNLSAERKTTVSALVRDAIERTYFRHRPPSDWRKILNEAAGSWKDRTDLPDTETYVRRLRSGSRAKRIRK